MSCLYSSVTPSALSRLVNSPSGGLSATSSSGQLNSAQRARRLNSSYRPLPLQRLFSCAMRRMNDHTSQDAGRGSPRIASEGVTCSQHALAVKARILAETRGGARARSRGQTATRIVSVGSTAKRGPRLPWVGPPAPCAAAALCAPKREKGPRQHGGLVLLGATRALKGPPNAEGRAAGGTSSPSGSSPTSSSLRNSVIPPMSRHHAAGMMSCQPSFLSPLCGLLQHFGEVHSQRFSYAENTTVRLLSTCWCVDMLLFLCFTTPFHKLLTRPWDADQPLTPMENLDGCW